MEYLQNMFMTPTKEKRDESPSEEHCEDIELSAGFDPAGITDEQLKVPNDNMGRYYARVMRNVFSPEECQMLIQLSEGKGYIPAKVNIGRGREALIPDYRKGDRCIIDSDTLAATLWTRIHHVVPLTRGEETAVGLNERFRFLRYDAGDFFSSHRDGTYVRDMEKGEDRRGERSRITVQIYLSHVEKGGATTVYSDDERLSVRVVPEPGLVFLFDHSVLHNGELVQAGRKYAIRTEVMYKRAQRSEPLINY